MLVENSAAQPQSSSTENTLKEAGVYYRESWTFETAGPYLMQDINFEAFASPSGRFCWNLAGITVAFTCGSYSYRAMKQTFAAFGFDHIRLFNYDRQDNNRSLNGNEAACGFAVRKINIDKKPIPLIALSIRGSIGQEILTNFMLEDQVSDSGSQSCAFKRHRQGAEGSAIHSGFVPAVHQGFLTPTAYVAEKLCQYIAEENLNPAECKILITGHSRGAAIADLLTLQLNAEHIAGCPFKQENIYTYTFGTPNSIACESPAVPGAMQKNIFNLINYQDVVGHLPGKYFSPGKNIYLNAPFEKNYAQHHAAFLKRYDAMVASAKYRGWKLPGNLIIQRLNRLPSKWLAKTLGGMITGLTLEDPKTTKALSLISACLSLGILETAAFKNGLAGLLLAGLSAKGLTAGAKAFADKIYTNHVMETYLCLVETYRNKFEI